MCEKNNGAGARGEGDMKKSWIIFAALFLFAGSAAAAPPLKLAAKYQMPASVQGRFDHLAVDVPSNRLFLAAESAHEVLVFNLRTGKYLRAITGIEIPHAIHVSDRPDRIFVTDGGAGQVKIFDGKTYKLLKEVPLKVDSDSIGYDPATRDLFVVNGGGDAHQSFSMVSIVNTVTDTKVADIQIDGRTLEAMALAHSSPLVYQNNPSMSLIDVVNRNRRTVVAKWPVTMCQRNVALAFDEADHRLFTGCRSGAIVVFDTQTGKQLQSLPIAQGVDDLIFDPASKRLYASCGSGDGSIDVYQEDSPDHYTSLGRVAAAPGSKNEVLAPSLGRLYTTIPPRAGAPGQVYVFQVVR
jgi:DNA-binding beta-propeller fold protein YncE